MDSKSNNSSSINQISSLSLSLPSTSNNQSLISSSIQQQDKFSFDISSNEDRMKTRKNFLYFFN